MFSLLPAQHKESLLREYRLRMLIVFLFGLASVIFVAIVGILPSYLRVKVASDSYVAEENSLKKMMSSDSDSDVIKSIENLKQEISIANISSGSPLGVIEKISSLKNKSIFITGFSYSYASGGSSVEVSGIASDRKSLTEFSKILSKEGFFKSIDLPLANLAKDIDIPFNITLTGDF